MHVVTSGSEFLDIDAYGGMIAYAELLNLQGEEAIAASSAPLNESITPTIRKWGAPLTTDYKPGVDDTFTLIDVSDPDFFDPIVDDDKVVGVIDHHPGFEDMWQSRLGDSAKIKFLGAACTLVYVEWVRAAQLRQVSQTSARLLIAGILDNTLNFKANVTQWRDREAYTVLSNYAHLPGDWSAQYFSECQQTIAADVPAAVRNDAKTMKDTQKLPEAFGQLVVWNAHEIIDGKRDEIAETLAAMSDDWAINVVSIEEGRSYFLADNPNTQQKFGAVMGLDLSSGVAEADRLYLRKEILKLASK